MIGAVFVLTKLERGESRSNCSRPLVNMEMVLMHCHLICVKICSGLLVFVPSLCFWEVGFLCIVLIYVLP